MKFKNKIIIIVILTLISIPILYCLSDRRIEAVKKVSYIFDIALSNDTKRIKEIYREANFHGDGVDSIHLKVIKKDREKFINDLLKINFLKVDSNLEEYRNISAEINYLKNNRDYNIGDINNYEVYYKKKKENNRFKVSNYYALLYNKENGDLIFIDFDS